ncbi:hypothetical protein ACFWMR_02280 [Amycolatopsis thailandensis]|uniref:hypothetical protein n=1 Tax=Amycolatopsis thailandensis TaxID=589330 RepID=UPI003649A7AC
MPRDHARLSLSIWANEDFKACTAGEQRVFMLLISQERINRAGVIDLRERPWSKLASDTTPDDIRTALKGLESRRFVVIDYDTEELLVRTFIRGDRIYRQPNVLKNALNAAQQVQSAKLRSVLADELRLCVPLIPSDRRDPDANREGVAALADRLCPPSSPPPGNPSDKGSAKGSPNPSAKGSLEVPELPDSEPFPEGFPEGFVEPPGEGEGVGEASKSPDLVVATRAHAREDVPPGVDNRRRKIDALNATATRSETRTLIAAWTSGHMTPLSQKKIQQMADEVDRAVRAGRDIECLAAALRTWNARADVYSPKMLIELYDDAAGRKNAGQSAEQPLVDKNGMPRIDPQNIPDEYLDRATVDRILGPDHTSPPFYEPDADPEFPRDETELQQRHDFFQAWMAERLAERRPKARRSLIRAWNAKREVAS